MNVKKKEKFEEICYDRMQEFQNRLQNEEYGSYQEFLSEFLEFKEQFERSVGRSAESEEYFKSMSESIYRQAGEKVSLRLERELEKEKRVLEQRYVLSQNDLRNKGHAWEEERKDYQRKISDLERERAQLIATDRFVQEKMERLVAERDKLEQAYEQLQEKHHENHSKITSLTAEQVTHLQKEIDTMRRESMHTISNFEKDNALLQQENKYCNKEIDRLNTQMERLHNQIQKYQHDNAQSHQTINQLKNDINSVEHSKKLDIDQLKKEFTQKLQVSTQESEQNKDLLKQHSETFIQKTYLENQVYFLQNQLDENKRLHDALLLALQCIHLQVQHTQIHGMQKEDGENTNELLETNKNLSAAMDKLEQRCRMLDQKVINLKEFKRMIKNCTSLQCINCSKFIANRIFIQHLNSCCSTLTTQPSSQTIQSLLSQSHHSYSNSNSNKNNSVLQSQILPSQKINNQTPGNTPNSQQSPFDVQSLSLAINQTIIRESADNKPYTEYIIQVNFMNKYKWSLAKKYKNFCELHHSLVTQFPNMKFPESSLAIINANSDMGTNVNQKRPALIEERRRALSQYIKDLARIDPIRNSKAFRSFLELEIYINTPKQEQYSNVNTKSINHNAGSFTESVNDNLQFSNRIQGKENDSSNQSSSSLYQQQPQSNIYSQVPQQPDTHQYQFQDSHFERKQLPQTGSFVEAWQNKENKKMPQNPRSKSMSEQQQELQFGKNQHSQQQQEEEYLDEEIVEREYYNEINERSYQRLNPQPQQKQQQMKYNGGILASPKQSQRMKEMSPLRQEYCGNISSNGREHTINSSGAQPIVRQSNQTIINRNSNQVQKSSVQKEQTYTQNYLKQQQQRSPMQIIN